MLLFYKNCRCVWNLCLVMVGFFLLLFLGCFVCLIHSNLEMCLLLGKWRGIMSLWSLFFIPVSWKLLLTFLNADFDAVSTSMNSWLLFVKNFCCEGWKSHLCAFFFSCNLLSRYKTVLIFGMQQFAAVIFWQSSYFSQLIYG